MKIVLSDGSEWWPDDLDLETWKATYPAVDVDAELRTIVAWAHSNKASRWTRSGVMRGVNRWLQKAQNEAASKAVKRPRGEDEIKQQVEIGAELAFHLWAADRMITAKLNNQPYQPEKPESYRFNLGRLVDRIVTDLRDNPSACYGTAHATIRQGWRW